MSFHFTERDLDLIHLEELHSDSGYAEWFSGRIGLGGWTFQSASHSIAAEANGRWGETDVLAIFVKEQQRHAVLIEDKVAAQFTERQAQRYHERGEDLVRHGECDSYQTVLVAPANYLSAVPNEDRWDCRISIEEVAGWFEQAQGHHARWRAEALKGVLDRLRQSTAPSDAETMAFSADLATYLATRHAPALTHRPGKDTSGPTLLFPGSSREKTLWWKFASAQMVLQLTGGYRGLAEAISLPSDINLERARDYKRGSDYLVSVVPQVDLSKALVEQLEVVEAAVRAALKLTALVPRLDTLAGGRIGGAVPDLGLGGEQRRG